MSAELKPDVRTLEKLGYLPRTKTRTMVSYKVTRENLEEVVDNVKFPAGVQMTSRDCFYFNQEDISTAEISSIIFNRRGFSIKVYESGGVISFFRLANRLKDPVKSDPPKKKS